MLIAIGKVVRTIWLTDKATGQIGFSVNFPDFELTGVWLDRSKTANFGRTKLAGLPKMAG